MVEPSGAAGTEGVPRSGATIAGGAIGVALLALSFTLFPDPLTLLLLGYEASAIVVTVIALPAVVVLLLLLVSPDRLQRALSRFTRVDLRDGGHVAAFVVMTLALFYVVGVQSASGVLAVEQVYTQPAGFDPPPASAPPGAPSGINLTANVTSEGVLLDWTPPERNGANMVAYRVYRGISEETVTFHTRVENATSYTDAGARGGLQYVYQVSGVNPFGEGAASEPVGVIVPIPQGIIMSAIMENLIVLILPVFFYVAFVHGLSPGQTLHELGLRSKGWLISLLIGVGAVIAAMIVMNLAILGLQQVQEVDQNERALAIGLGIGVVGALAIAVGSSISEEVFYRGFLQPRVGMVGQAVIFAIAHVSYVNVLEVVVVFLLAFVFGFLYKWTNNLWAPIAAHFTFNLINLLAIVCGADPSQCGIPEV